MKSEESFTAFIKRSGAQLTSKIDILGPKGESIVYSHAVPENAPTINTGPLSASGTYKIEVSNWRLGGGSGKTGKYQLYIGCDTLTGSIRPGEIAPASTVSEELPVIAPKVFLEVGASYDVHLASGVYAVKLVEIREDGWIEVIIDNRVGWLNPSQVALIIPLD